MSLRLNGRTLRRGALVVLTVVMLAYLGVMALLFFNQRTLLYRPVADRAAPDLNGPAIQVVRIETADGESLVGWWLPPENDRPTVLFFNGNAAGLSVQRGRWRRIADTGVGFLAVAYRGYDGSTGRPTEAGLHEDANAAYEWLTQRVDPGDEVIHGFSLGSGVATRLASQRPARALVLEAPFTSTADVAAARLPFAPVHLLMRDQYRSRDLIDQVGMPLLVLHGDADSVVPFDQGRTLYGMATPPKQFVRMVGSDHNTLVRDGAYDHIWRFLDIAYPDTTAAEGQAADSVVEQAPRFDGAVL